MASLSPRIRLSFVGAALSAGFLVCGAWMYWRTLPYIDSTWAGAYHNAIAIALAVWPLGYMGKLMGDRYLRKPIPTERRCVRCGYDLCSTADDSPCPECGLAAHRSVFEHVNPDDCPPAWVMSIAIASAMLLIAYLAFAAVFAMAMLDMAWHRYGVEGLVLPAMCSTAVVHAAANMLLSREDRRRPFNWWTFLHRWLLRVVPLFPAAGITLNTLSYMQWIVLTPVINSWIPLLLVPLLLCPTLTFFRLRRLAVRLSRPRLAEHITIVAVGALVSVLYTVGCGLFMMDEVHHLDAKFIAFMVMPFVLIALFNLWSLLLLFVIVPRFFRSARQARANWRAADAALTV